MVNKFGSYVQKLMTTVLDKEQEEFIINLALSELKQINSNIEDFIRKHEIDDFDKSEKTIKQLLQEDKDVKDK